MSDLPRPVAASDSKLSISPIQHGPGAIAKPSPFHKAVPYPAFLFQSSPEQRTSEGNTFNTGDQQSKSQLVDTFRSVSLPSTCLSPSESSVDSVSLTSEDEDWAAVRNNNRMGLDSNDAEGVDSIEGKFQAFPLKQELGKVSSGCQTGSHKSPRQPDCELSRGDATFKTEEKPVKRARVGLTQAICEVDQARLIPETIHRSISGFDNVQDEMDIQTGDVVVSSKSSLPICDHATPEFDQAILQLLCNESQDTLPAVLKPYSTERILWATIAASRSLLRNKDSHTDLEDLPSAESFNGEVLVNGSSGDNVMELWSESSTGSLEKKWVQKSGENHKEKSQSKRKQDTTNDSPTSLASWEFDEISFEMDSSSVPLPPTSSCPSTPNQTTHLLDTITDLRRTNQLLQKHLEEEKTRHLETVQQLRQATHTPKKFGRNPGINPIVITDLALQLTEGGPAVAGIVAAGLLDEVSRAGGWNEEIEKWNEKSAESSKIMVENPHKRKHKSKVVEKDGVGSKDYTNGFEIWEEGGDVSVNRGRDFHPGQRLTVLEGVVDITLQRLEVLEKRMKDI